MLPDEEFVLKANKSLPAENDSEDTIIEISADVKEIGDIIKELDKNPIPKSWSFASEVLIQQISPFFEKDHKGKFVVMVAGKTKGKTTQVLFHANRLAQIFSNVYVVDGDMGQQSLYMPGTVAVAKIEHPVLSFYELNYQDARFTGFICGGNSSIRIQTQRISELVENVPKGSIVIVDTDGWIAENGLVQKVMLLDYIKPNFVFILDSKEQELFTVMMKASLEKRNIQYLVVPDDNEYYLPRSQEERKQHRSLMYYRFFSASTDRRISRSKIKIYKEFYRPETGLIERGDARLEEFPVREGTLCGLFDNQNKFLGLAYFLGANKKEIWLRISEIVNDIDYIIIGWSWIDL